MKNLKTFNEHKSQTLNWKEIESKWDKWYEESNNEADYDEEYDAMKNFTKDSPSYTDVDWKQVKKEYFKYIEETGNEDDGDIKFKKFKKTFNQYKLNESSEDEDFYQLIDFDVDNLDEDYPEFRAMEKYDEIDMSKSTGEKLTKLFKEKLLKDYDLDKIQFGRFGPSSYRKGVVLFRCKFYSQNTPFEVEIKEYEDERFFVTITEMTAIEQMAKCDQLDGVIKFLQDAVVIEDND